MGALRIQVFTREKALEVLGAVAFGESVPVIIAFQDDAPDSGDFRLRIRFMGADVAAFPLLDGQGQTTDEWEAGTATGEWTTSPAMTLNTPQLRACFPPNPPDGMRIQALVMLDCTTSGGETLHAEGRLPILWWAANPSISVGELPAPIDMAAAYEALDERMTDAEGDIDALETTVENKADSSHSHTHSDITDFTSAVQTVIPVSSSIIQNDSNPVSGGAIYTALAGAKDYTDAAKDAAEDYADTQDAETLASAKEYADGKDATNLTTAKTYADGKASAAETAAKDYADTKDAAVLSAVENAYVKKSDAVTVFRYKGSKATYSALPYSGNTTGDVWNVEAAYADYPAGTNFVWNGTGWDALGGSVDLSAYRTAAAQDVIDAGLKARGYIQISNGHIQAVIP